MRHADVFSRNTSGSVAVITALSFTVLAAFAAFAIDAGGLYYQRRHQQSATDLAAIAAASNLGSAATAAASAAAANGFLATDVAAVELGTYTADPTLLPAQRFATPAATPNAVRVTMTKVRPYLFGWFASASAAPGGGALIATRSIASASNLAAFALGSGLASLNGGVVNGVLGNLLGTTLSLSAMDYQNLASANIDMFAFSNALATRLNLTAATYSQLASTTVTLPTALRAIADVAPSSQVASALGELISALNTQSGSLNVGSLVSYGSYGANMVGAVAPLTATVNALGLVSALAQVANGQNQVETALNVGLPGIASASVKVAIGAPPVGSGLVAIGAAGATLTTTQTRVRLDLQVGGPPPTNLLSVPIILNVAYATASLANVTCGANESVTLNVTPGLVDAWIGTVSDQTLANFSASLAPPPAQLVNIAGLVGITGSAHAAIANMAATPVTFGAAAIASGAGQTVSTTDYLSPLLSSLFGTLNLNVSVLGLGLLNTSALNTAVLQTLAADVAPIDTILASTLAALGISVGNATVWVTGVKCGQSVLVN